MKNQNRIYIFFIVLAILFFNPLTYYLVYGSTVIYSSKILKTSMWIFFILGMLSIILIVKNYCNKTVKNIIFSFAFAGVIFSILVGLDSFAGCFLTKKTLNTEEGMIFNPNEIVKYHTIEFENFVKINKLGFRGKDINIDKGSLFRIICFGDSWTFGWGVDDDETWPNELETYFMESGYSDIEVLNLGRPGQYTLDYKNNMEKILPILKPDLVLVGVLQLEDLSELYVKSYTKPKTPYRFQVKNILFYFANIKSLFVLYIEISFNNIISLFSKNASSNLEATATWKEQNLAIIDNFSFDQMLNFNTFSDTIISLFKTGDLSPYHLNSYINNPFFDLIFNDPTQAVTIAAINRMRTDLEGMKEICDKNNVKFIFINMPEAQFTGHQFTMTPADQFLKTFLYSNNNIDSIYRSLAEYIDIPYFELTEKFKRLKEKSNYFYRFDGHPTPKGQKEIATIVGDTLLNMIESHNIVFHYTNK